MREEQQDFQNNRSTIDVKKKYVTEKNVNKKIDNLNGKKITNKNDFTY